MIKDFFNNNWKYLVILLGFFVVAAIYFFPVIQGFSLVQGDISTWRATAKEMQDFRTFFGEETAWTNSIFGGMPGFIIDLSYMNGFLIMSQILSMKTPFPINMMFIAMLSFFILAKSLKIETLIGVLGAFAYGFMAYHMHILAAGHNTKMGALSYMPAVLGTFIMVYQSKKIILSAALFAFFMALEILSGHIQMTYYLGFILIAIGIYQFIKSLIDKQVKSFFIRTGMVLIALVFSLLANFTTSYYTYSYGQETMRGAPELTINPDGSDKVASQSTGLDRDYIVNWCYGKQETLNLLIPNVKGDSKNLTGEYFDYLRAENPALFNFSVEQYQKTNGKVFGGYWGDQPFTSGANYLGAIIVLFAIMYLVLVKSSFRWPLLGVIILTVLLSWGKNLGGSIEEMWLTNFFIDYVPLYSKFRTVSSMMIVLNLLFPLMAMLFVNHVYNNQEWAKENIKKLMLVGGSVAGFVLILALLPGLLDFTSDIEDATLNQMYVAHNSNPASINPADAEAAVTDFRISAFRSDAYRTLLFLIIGLAILFLWITKKIKYNVAIICLSTVALIDVWMIDKRYLSNTKNPQNKREYLSWEKNTGFGNTPNATQGDFDIYNKEVAKNPAIEQEFQTRKAEPVKEDRKNTRKIEESIRFATLNFNSNYRVMNLDNPFNSASVCYFHKSTGGYHAAKMARYQDLIDFYISKEVNMLQTPEKIKVLNMLNNKYFLYQGNLVFDNPYAYGNAWIVKAAKLVNNPNEEIIALGEIDPKTTAVVHQEYAALVSNISNDITGASIVMDDYKPNHIAYTATANTNVLAVFSELHYKDDWVAYIDGKEVEHLRANYVLRALNIPGGTHKVEFKFEPKMLATGNVISLLAFAIIAITLLLTAFPKLLKFKKD